jgi:hypothetical protein
MAYSKMCIYCHVVTLEGYNAEQRKYYEQGTTQLHTRERCAEARSKAGLPAYTPSANPRPIQAAPTIEQNQKSADIKAAQIERKRQHVEFIKNLQWNTRMLAQLNQTNGGGDAKDILDAIGFEEYREEQRDFVDDML